MSLPPITVITVSYQAAACITGTIESVLHLDYPHLEYIVVDGGSKDGTMQIVKSYVPRFERKGITCRYVSESDNGIYHAMNKGIAMATGEWVNFMNAGDSFASSDVLKRIFAASVPFDTGVVYGNVRLLKAFGTVVLHPKPIDFLERKMAFCHQAAFVRTDEMRRFPFDLRYRLAADYDFFYRYRLRGGAFRYVDIDVANYESEGGVSSRNRLKKNREYARIRGVDARLGWKLSYLLKCAGVFAKDAFYRILPAGYVARLRERNYRRLQKRRLGAAK